MANLKDTHVQGNLLVDNAPTQPHHVVRNDDARMTDSRAPLGHTHTVAQITDAGTAATKNVHVGAGNAANGEVVLGNDGRLSDARPPSAHTHPITDITGRGTAAALDVPAAVNGVATGAQVVRGDDPRLSDSRTPLAHTHANATPDPGGTPGFISAADQKRLNDMAAANIWLPAVATYNNLPLAGDILNTVRMAADTGVVYQHIALAGTVDQQWRPAGGAGGAIGTLYIGASARLVAISGGVAIEVFSVTDNVWKRQAAWSEV